MSELKSPSSQTGECYRCGYDLRETPDNQPCPECGLLAIRSRRLTDEIRYSHPRWLKNISHGSNLILAGTLFIGTWIISAPTIADQIFIRAYRAHARFSLGSIRYADKLVYWIIMSGIIVGMAILLRGILQITARDGQVPIRRGESIRRMLIRSIIWIVPICIFGAQLFPHRVKWEIRFAVAACLAISVVVSILFLHLRDIAVRARSAHLVEHCVILAGGSTVAFLAAASQFMIRGFDAFGDKPYTVSVIIHTNFDELLVLLTSLLLTLFALWSLYLFTRFTISFHNESRRVNTLWQRDDRSDPVIS